MWARKRKFFILSSIFLILSAIAFSVYKVHFERAATCFDNLMNGFEEGIDCGGECKQICSISVSDINIIWSKSFEAAEGVFNVAALIENPNHDYEISGKFLIKAFDDAGGFVVSFDRDLILKAGEKRVLYIPGIIAEKTIIKNTFVDLKETYSVVNSKITKNKIIVNSKILSEVDSQTLLTVGLENKGIYSNRNIEVIAVLSDKSGKIIDVGKTFVNYIGKRDRATAVMIWQKHFEEEEDLSVNIFLREERL